MFERFSSEARQVVEEARKRAVLLGGKVVEPNHLLLGVLLRPSQPVVTALSTFGEVSQLALAVQSRLEALDSEALASVGISLEQVRAHAGEIRATPPEHVKFNYAAKKVLEDALRQALKLRHRYIGPEHVMLALLQRPSARSLLESSGIAPNDLEVQLLAELRAA